MRVVVVDDGLDFDLAMFRLAIERAAPGCSLTWFNSPVEALHHLQIAPPDVAFLRARMQAMDGLLLATKLRSLHPRINIIFIAQDEGRALDAFALHASGYLLEPISEADIASQMHNLRYAVATKAQLKVQCFGRFQVYAGDKPVYFASEKTKELLAYLISCRGAACTNREITAVLWEDRPNSDALQGRFRQLVADLSATLRQVGAKDVLLHKKGQLAIAIDKVDCDVYDYLRGDAQARQRYTGEFMSQYPWAETGFDNLGNKRPLI